MKLYALVLTVAALLIVAPAAWANSEPTENVPDETTEHQAALLQPPTGNLEISTEDAKQPEREMQGVSQTMNSDRPRSSGEILPGFRLPEGMVIRGSGQGVGVGVEF